MKKLLWITLLFAMVLNAYSQTQAGKILVGADSRIGTSFGSYKYQYDGKTIGNKTTYSNFNINPSFGYFVVENLVVGLSVNLSTSSSKSGSNEYSSTSFGAGPFGRYYFGQTKIKPFVGGSFGFTSSSNKNNSSTSKYGGFSISAGGGIAYFVNDYISIDGQLSYIGTSSKDKDDTKSVEKEGQLAIGIGFSLCF